jgi:TatD DNase family protein
MIDIGLNLTNPQFRHDIAGVLQQALHVGVEAMIVTGTSVQSSQDAYKLAQEYPDCLFATAGIHPHDASTFDAQSIQQLTDLLNQEKVVAVGECGLDFNRNFSTPAQQRHCFEELLKLAVKLNMPVFLHQRDALDEFLELVQIYRSDLAGAVSHCFTGDKEELKRCLDYDMYIGITGWICDERRGQDLQEAVKYIPKNRLMIETDAPYLFPRDLNLPQEPSVTSAAGTSASGSLKIKKKKNSRRRNEPQYLPHILKTLAGYTAMDEAVLRDITVENTRRFFNL